MAAKSNQNRPVRVAYDISEMSAGGLNGGIKTHHYEFLKAFTKNHSQDLELLVFCKAEIVEELQFLSQNPFNQIHILGSAADLDLRNNNGKNPTIRVWSEIPNDLLVKLGVDVLYCGFAVSELYTPAVPQISLLVDVLHKDLPDALPPKTVIHRDAIFKRAIEQSALIQTNSKFCVESLKKHYQVPDEKLFYIYLPLHGRFNDVEMGPLPQCLEGKKYFFYPANHWPHKNHDRLLEAYKLYLEGQQDGELWDLALTGYMPIRTDGLKEFACELGLQKSVHFLGHLDMSILKSVWELSSAMIFPSLYEGFGIPILEAAHFQTPVGSSRNASLGELDDFITIHFDPTNASSISEALHTLSSVQHNKARIDCFDLGTCVTTQLEAIRNCQLTYPKFKLNLASEPANVSRTRTKRTKTTA